MITAQQIAVRTAISPSLLMHLNGASGRGPDPDHIQLSSACRDSILVTQTGGCCSRPRRTVTRMDSTLDASRYLTDQGPPLQSLSHIFCPLPHSCNVNADKTLHWSPPWRDRVHPCASTLCLPPPLVVSPVGSTTSPVCVCVCA